MLVWMANSSIASTLGCVCAGTSDITVAEEAQITAEVMGNSVVAIHDIGVAGFHRLIQNRERLLDARVVVVCAGMEGALPSAVGGMVSCPVIAVPTSVGYGASFNGLAALLVCLAKHVGRDGAFRPRQAPVAQV